RRSRSRRNQDGPGASPGRRRSFGCIARDPHDQHDPRGPNHPSTSPAVARTLVLLLLAAAAALAAAPGHARAAQCARFASSAGRDGASGSAAHPFRTAGRLIRSLPNGATGCLVGGSTFSGRVVVDHPLTLRGIGSRRPVIVGGVTITPQARR